jgi:mannose-1-phosphate guanylyltransferase
MDKNLHLVVMAGGTGTRFWPYSRQNRPKQFLDILGTGKSLLQMTCDRFESMVAKNHQIIVSNVHYEKLLKEQFPKYSKNQFFLEPQRKNTAACIAFAAYKLRQINPDAIMIVTPADHAIFQELRFLEIVNTAVEAAQDGKLVTIGVKPNKPETGYGYIQYIESKGRVKKVKTFTEKPEQDLAEKFIDSGDFVWNTGIFVWSVKAIIEAFEKHEPEMAEVFEEGKKYYYGWKERKFIESAYAQCRSISVDYAIMEKAENVHMVPGEFGWSDLGSWGSVHELRDKDAHGNLVTGEAIIYESNNNFIHLQNGKMAIIEGLDDHLIADFKDVLLVCKKDGSSKFREFIKDIKDIKREDLL